MNRSTRSLMLALFLLAPVAQAEGVARGERDLVAIVNLSRLKKFKLAYEYEESRAVMKIKRDLGQAYRKIHFLTGKHATHSEFLAELAAAENDPALKAVDVIVYLHGHPGELGFVDTGFYPVDRLRDEILAIPSESGPSPTKLRALYSDACYGATHMADWLKAGFRVATGAVGVDGNWSLDLNKFMNAWGIGRSFGVGIDRANSVRATKLMDRIAGGNSFKLTDGDSEFTIDRSPSATSVP